MGRRRKRKDERRLLRRERSGESSPEARLVIPGDDEIAAVFADLDRRADAAQRICGNCIEFVENVETGRGSCLHPASGVLVPWNDTSGCDYFAPRRRARRPADGW